VGACWKCGSSDLCLDQVESRRTECAGAGAAEGDLDDGHKDKEALRCEMVEYDRRKGRGGTAASKGGIWQRAAGEGAAGSPPDGMTSTLKDVLKPEPSLLEARKLFSSANQCKFVKRDQWQLMGLVKRCFPCRMRLRAEGHGSFLWHLMKIRGCKKEKASVEFALL